MVVNLRNFLGLKGGFYRVLTFIVENYVNIKALQDTFQIISYQKLKIWLRLKT